MTPSHGFAFHALRASPPVRLKLKTYTGMIARLSREFIVVELLKWARCRATTSDDLTYDLILMHNMSHAMGRRSRPHWKLAAYGAPTVMDSFTAVSDSASSGDDERMQRCRRYAIRTVMSAVTEAGISDGTSTRLGVAATSLGEHPTEIEPYHKAS
jgi:3-oxoacyl-(acyl-carrier-protein) synthase